MARAKTKLKSKTGKKSAVARKKAGLSRTRAASEIAKTTARSARQRPIEHYYWPTPNGWKTAIMLEECGLPYTLIPVDISRGDQFKPDFLKISPNNRMPAIVDPDGPGGRPISVFESRARSCNISGARPGNSIRRTSAPGSKWTNG